MKETPFYFPSGDKSLFGILHEPEKATGLSAFVFCHPFGEEKLWSHRVFVSLARRLAVAGHAVLRFDYMGNGDSDGDFCDTSLTTALSDVRAAVEQVQRMTDTTRVSLFGLRLGATIASLIAEEVTVSSHLILWAPIVDGARYMQELLRINLTTQMAVYREIRHDRQALVAALRQGQMVNVDGYEIAYSLYSEVSAVKLTASRKRHQGRCLVLDIDRRPTPLSEEPRQLAASYPRADFIAVQEEPFWKETARFYETPAALFAPTCSWLSANEPIR